FYRDRTIYLIALVQNVETISDATKNFKCSIMAGNAIRYGGKFSMAGKGLIEYFAHKESRRNLEVWHGRLSVARSHSLFTEREHLKNEMVSCAAGNLCELPTVMVQTEVGVHKCSVCDKYMHGPCGISSDESNKLFGDNSIKYAKKCHLCAVPKTTASRGEGRAPLRRVLSSRQQEGASSSIKTNLKDKTNLESTSVHAAKARSGKKRSSSSAALELPHLEAKKRRNAGVAKGSKRIDRPQSFWKPLCRNLKMATMQAKLPFSSQWIRVLK
ncbi:MAG: hypothetical protein ACREOZ_02405, partial [Gloeomargaritales cyanobacterium]